MSKIKICGIKRMPDIEYVNEASPDYIGFVFAKSPRQVNFEVAAELKKNLDHRIKAVGVFVNAPIKEILALVNAGIIDLIQLHGDEDVHYIEQLKDHTSVPIIKAVRVQNQQDIIDKQELPYEFLLLDTFQKDVYGGSGKTFDWKLIPQLKKPFFLAGGINIENINRAICECHPYCLDVSSSVETDGVKDREKIIEIITKARNN